MDYSLLLAIEENPNYRRHAATTIRKLSRASSSDGAQRDKSGSVSRVDSHNSQDLSQDENILPHQRFKSSRHMFLSSNLQYIYHISIIDYLQDYNLDKKFENFAKTILRGRKAEISAVPPKRYSKRYIDFMENEVIIADKKSSSSGSGELPVIPE